MGNAKWWGRLAPVVLILHFTLYTFHSPAASPELLAPPQFGDPTRMSAYAASNAMDVATAFFDDDGATNFTALVWLRWTPRAGFESIYVPFVNVCVSADAARSTREGGDALADLQSHRYEVPLKLTNGTWGETCLPSYEHPSSLNAWQYGCYCVNVETDTALTLNIAGAEKSVPAAEGMQVFNMMGETASRAVSISAANTSAVVRFSIAENPLVQFIGAQVDDGDSHGSWTQGETGGLAANAWRLMVTRGRIAANAVTVYVCEYTPTAKLENEQTVTQTLWRPRATFARNARIRTLVASLSGIRDGDSIDVFTCYGLRVYRGWLDDATVERMRDQDAAEMTRRGM